MNIIAEKEFSANVILKGVVGCVAVLWHFKFYILKCSMTFWNQYINK